jgi:hypothetical protein
MLILSIWINTSQDFPCLYVRELTGTVNGTAFELVN